MADGGNRGRAVSVNARIWGETRQSGDINTLFNILRTAPGINVVASSEIPPQSIALDGKVLSVIDDFDAWDSLSTDKNDAFREWVTAVRPACVFKLQFRRGATYPPGTISAGYFCHPGSDFAEIPIDLLTRARPIDIVARMRTHEYASDDSRDWMDCRRQIVKQAAGISERGYVTAHGLVHRPQYLRELWNAKVGFHWRGWGMLTYRLIEYLRAGVVPITQPLGVEWPIRDGMVLEDGVHCIFCDNPRRFATEAKALLRDPAKLEQMRRNIVDLWNAELAPAPMARWYVQTLREAQARLEPAT